MIEILFRYAEDALHPDNILISILLSILVSCVVCASTVKFYDNVRAGLWSGVVTQCFLILMLIAVRERVSVYRRNVIRDTLSRLDPATPCKYPKARGRALATWREGLELVEDCPHELGFYIDTADILAREGDYHSAIELLEQGSDFYTENRLPLSACSRLQEYYRQVPDLVRPTINGKCDRVYWYK